MKEAIIVADDSVIIRNIVSKSLRDRYVVLQASNGDQTIKLVVQNKNYKIVGLLLDLKMPESDGFKVLDYFKQNNLFKNIPVAIISGDDSKETINKAFTYNIVDMLNKPFSKDNIMNVVSKLREYKKI